MEIAVKNNIRNWWVFLLRGILFIALGIYMFMAPVASYITLSFFFGVIVLLAGVAELLYAYTNRHHKGWGWRLFSGIIDLVLGIILVSNLAVSMSVLPFVMAAWFFFRGFSLFSFAAVVSGSWWLNLGGVLSVLFALLILFHPAIGAITIVLWTAFAFFITGIFNVLLAFRLKRLQ